MEHLIAQIDIGDLSHVGDAGVAVALIVLLIVVALALWKLGLEWLKTRREIAGLEHEREMKRIQAENGQTEALDALRKGLESQQKQRDADQAVTSSLLAAIRQLTTAVDRLNASQTEAASRMAAVTEQRNEKLNVMHNDIQGVAGVVQAGLEPQMDRLRTLIQDGFEDIEQAIMQQAEAMGEQLTPSLRQVLQQEIQTYSRQTTRQMERLTALVEALNPESKAQEKEGQADGQHRTD